MTGTRRVLLFVALAAALGVLLWIGLGDVAPPTLPLPAERPSPGRDRPASLPSAALATAPVTTGATVRVIDLFRRPVAGATVEAIPDRNYEKPWFERAVAGPGAEAVGETDAGGRVLLSPLSPGKWTFRAFTEGRVSRPYSVVQLRAGPPVTVILLLGEAHTLSGTVRQADGSPAAGARVAIRPQGEHALRRVVASGADGSYCIELLPPGSYQGSAAPSPGAFGGTAEIVIPAERTHDFTLRPTGVISGRVTRLSDGAPIEGATVLVGICIPVGTSVLPATTDADGCYRVMGIPHRQNTRITALAPGRVPAHEEHDYHWLYIDRGAERVVDFRLRQGAAVSGIVRGPDGEPVEAASVTLFGNSAWGQTFSRETLTDGEGAFRFEALPTGYATVRAQAPGLHQPGFPEKPWDLGPRRRLPSPLRPITIPTSGETNVTINLVPTGRIEGTVLDASGGAAAGVLVGVSQDGVPRVVSGPDGAFVLDEVRSGAGIVVEAAPVSGIPGQADPVDLGPGETVRGITVRLPAGVVVRGTVRSESGVALKGAMVCLGLLEEDEPGMLYWPSARDHPVHPDGTFEIPITESAGWFAVQARAEGMPGRETETVEIIPGKRVFEVHVVLPDPVEIDGLVVDAETGETLPGAVVSVTSTLHDEVQRPLTGADGRFSTRVRPGENFALHVWAEGYVHVHRYDVAAGTRDLCIELHRSAEIRGRVITEDGGPAPNLEIRATGADGRDGKAWSGADGRFVIRSIPAGTYAISVRPDEDGGLDFVGTRVASVETGGPEIVIIVSRAARIEGRVVDEDGMGLPGESVVARNEETRRQGRRVLSGPDGSFAVPVLPDGTYSVTAGRPGRTHVPATVDGAGPGTIGLTIILPRGLTIAGRLVDSIGATVTGLWSRMDLSESVASDFYIFGNVEKDGTFVFRGLPEGKFTLHFIPWPLEGWLRRTVEAVPAGTTDLCVEIRPAALISGIVVDQAGKPVEGVGIVSAGKGRSWWSWGQSFDTWTDHRGNFSIGGLQPGEKFTVVVGGAEEGWSSAGEHAVATGREDLRFVVSKGKTISGGVWDAGGVVVDEAVVATLDEHGLPLAWTEVDSDGAFELPGLPDGKSTLWVLPMQEGAKPIRIGLFKAGASEVRLELPAE
jgi:Carboxypeptidase regulatory-like domain